MSIGDRIPTELSFSGLTSSALTYFTNGGDNYRTQILQLILCNTGTSVRTISIYKNGLSASNMLLSSIILPENTSIIIDLKCILTNYQTIGAKQDDGTDVNICFNGVVEQLI